MAWLAGAVGRDNRRNAASPAAALGRSPNRDRREEVRLDGETHTASWAVFRPEQFFLGRTEGWAAVRDPFGRLQRRCVVTTEGRWHDSYGAIHLDETFRYDDGEVDEWRWAIAPGGDGRYVAAEASLGSGITGEVIGGEYVIAFNRALPGKPDWLKPRFVSRFCQVGPRTALKTVNVSILGVTVGVMTAVHERVD